MTSAAASVTSLPETERTSRNVGACMIRADGLVKCYGALRAIDGVGFQVARGEVVGFLGPNGAGKSTTMKVLTGYLYPDAGTVEIAGHALSGKDASAQSVLEARRHIGYLPENVPIYPDLRVEQYLRYRAALKGVPRRERARAVDSALEKLRKIVKRDEDYYERER